MQQLIEYIKSTRQQGYTDAQIKDHLLRNGYTEQLVNRAFASLQPKKKTHANWKIPVLVLVGILVVGGIAAGIYFVLPSLNLPAFGSNACKNISVQAFNVEGAPVLCQYNDFTKVQIIVENTGKSTIDMVRIEMESDAGAQTYELSDALPAFEQNFIAQIITLDEPSRVETLKIIPVVEGKACQAKVYSDVRLCS